MFPFCFSKTCSIASETSFHILALPIEYFSALHERHWIFQMSCIQKWVIAKLSLISSTNVPGVKILWRTAQARRDLYYTKVFFMNYWKFFLRQAMFSLIYPSIVLLDHRFTTRSGYSVCESVNMGSFFYAATPSIYPAVNRNITSIHCY